MTGANIERTLGILTEQGRWVAKKVETIERDVREMKRAHLSLLTEHWKLYAKVTGFSVIVSLVTAGLVEFIAKAVAGN